VEIGTGLDIAEAVNETDCLCGNTPFTAAGRKGQGTAFELDPFGFCFLGNDPVIVGSAGRSHENIIFQFFLLIMPVKNILVILFRDQFLHDLFAAPGRNYHEHVPGRCPQRLGNFEGIGNVELIALGKGRVDQEFLAMLAKMLGSVHNPLKSAGRLPEIVMHLGSGAIQRERNHLDVRFFHLFANVIVYQGTVCRHADAQAERCAILGKFEYIRPEQRLATGKHNYRL